MPVRSVMAFIVLSVVAIAGAAAAAADAQLTPADTQSLDKLAADGFDPRGKRFVRFKVFVRTVWAHDEEREVRGWLVEPKGEQAFAVLETGEETPVVTPTTAEDFVARCREVLKRGVPKPPEKEDDFDATFRRMRESTVSGFFAEPVPSVHLAAWLRRLGDDALAAEMYRAAVAGGEKREAARPTPRRATPWDWFACAVHSYMVRADAEALFYLRRMKAYHPDAMKAAVGGEDGGRARDVFPQAALLLAELERREKEGNFNNPPAAHPADLKEWPVERRVAYWIAQLQEVDARQNGQPGGVELGEDERIRALVAIGDSAVPALIECLEADARLTRSVHFWRDFSQDRTVLGVREAALTALMSILRVRVFEPVSTGDNFTGRGPAAAKDTTARIRAYWKTYGSMPFDVRMMTVLRDERATPAAWREAAANLGEYGVERSYGTTVFTGRAGRDRDPSQPHPLVGTFKAPTVAEALLAAMDRNLRAEELEKSEGFHGGWGIDVAYLVPLTELGDRAIVPTLRKRLDAARTTRMRRLLAWACFELGETEPMDAYAADVVAGRIGAGPEWGGGEAARVELDQTVRTLLRVAPRHGGADRALHALADAKNPLHHRVAARVRDARSSFDDGWWVAHPFALRILRPGLDDLQPTGSTVAIEHGKDGERLTSKTHDGSGSMGLPALLRDPAVRRERAEERACDVAAERISKLIAGVRPYHVLLKDADARLVELRAFVDRHQLALRPATYPERDLLGSTWDPLHLLDVKRLGRGATAADVVAGRALFHFDGKGVEADQPLPAVATLKRDLPPDRAPTSDDVAADRAYESWKDEPGQKEPRRIRIWQTREVLVVQAERGPDGKVTYGYVARHEMGTATEDEVATIKPLTPRH
jgi:hypothetical protein